MLALVHTATALSQLTVIDDASTSSQMFSSSTAAPWFTPTIPLLVVPAMNNILNLSPLDACAVVTDGVTLLGQPGHHPTLVYQPALLHVVLRLWPGVNVLTNHSAIAS